MYKLTNIMLQHLEKNLIEFHKLFQGGRCQAWQLEELVAKAINSDFNAIDKAFWKGNGHDIEADISVGPFKISVKSGTIKKNKQKQERLVISGHRLGRFEGNLDLISEFLNSNEYLLISVPYFTTESENGKQHSYQLIYMNADILKPSIWQTKYSKKNKDKISQYYSINELNVLCSVNPSMSWQVWWEIPMQIIKNENKTRLIIVN